MASIWVYQNFSGLTLLVKVCYASKFKQHHLRNSNLALTPEIWGAHASNSHEWIKLIFHYILH